MSLVCWGINIFFVILQSISESDAKSVMDRKNSNR